jgi:uncharacterized protein (TIGR00297 family)
MAYTFVLFCKVDDHIRIGIAFVLAFTFGISALLLNWLTLDGVRAAVLFGTIAYGIGNLVGAAVVLGFFISSSLVSQNQVVNAFDNRPDTKRFRRDGAQVWANGFWFALFILSWFISGAEILLLAAIASIAAANADTWATEIGGHFRPGKTWLITNFKQVTPGTDGGVSIKGFAAALLGSAVIAAIYWLLNMDAPLMNVILLSVCGFIGSLADSIFGATLQNKTISWTGKPYPITNNAINAMSTGTASIILILTYLLI